MNIEFKPGVRRLPDVLTLAKEMPEDKAPKKKEKTPTYNFTLAQLESMKNKAVDSAVQDAVQTLIELTVGLPVMILSDKHGWDKESMGQFVTDVMNLYDSYEQGYLTLEDIRDTLLEEAEVRIKRK